MLCVYVFQCVRVPLTNYVCESKTIVSLYKFQHVCKNNFSRSDCRDLLPAVLSEQFNKLVSVKLFGEPISLKAGMQFYSYVVGILWFWRLRVANNAPCVSGLVIFLILLSTAVKECIYEMII